MPSLVPGLDDHVERELDRLRSELKVAIAESGYTLEQVASLAGVGRTTLRAMLIGEAQSQIDTLLRAGFVVGLQFEMSPASDKEHLSFQITPLAATASRGSSHSTRSRASASGSARGESDSHTKSKKAVAKKGDDQRRKRSPRKGVTGWSPHSPIHLVECGRSSVTEPRLTAPESEAA